MDNPLGGSLDGIARIVVENWFAAMGLVGLIVFVTSLMIELHVDNYTVGCIGLIMMGWGFGQTDCRTFQHTIGYGWKIKRPTWRLTFTGASFFLIALGSAVALGLHLLR